MKSKEWIERKIKDLKHTILYETRLCSTQEENKIKLRTLEEVLECEDDSN